jgi:hypothetical protein
MAGASGETPRIRLSSISIAGVMDASLPGEDVRHSRDRNACRLGHFEDGRPTVLDGLHHPEYFARVEPGLQPDSSVRESLSATDRREIS